MNRPVVRLLLAVLLLALGAAPLPVRAHGEEPVRVERLQVGPYPLTVQYYTPPIAQQPLELVLIPEGPVQLRAEVLTLSDPEALPLSLDVQPDPAHGPTAVAITWTPAMGGEWELMLHLEGEQGPASAPVEIEVAPPVKVPHWLAWLVGLSPLYALLWFFSREVRRVRRESALPVGGSA